MDSSFLTGSHLVLGIISSLFFIKMIIQFGLPNHPARFVSYLVCFCIVIYFGFYSLISFRDFSTFSWIKIRSIPLVAGGLCLLLQTIMLAAGFSLIQQKIISRLPIIASLLCAAFFPEFANPLFVLFILLGGLFLIISVKKARYQKRLYLKMMMMFLLYLGLNQMTWPAFQVLSQIFLGIAVFYIFLFEHSFGISALVDDFRSSFEGEGR